MEQECISVEQAAVQYDADNFGWPTPDKKVIMSEEKTREWNIAAFKAGAQWQKEQYAPLLELLKGIAEWAGNLSDKVLQTRTGPNYAALRGGLICDMRDIAIEAIKIIEPDYKPLHLNPKT